MTAVSGGRVRLPGAVGREVADSRAVPAFNSEEPVPRPPTLTDPRSACDVRRAAVPKIPPSEHEWIQDKARFAANTASRDHGFPLGPLAQQFAALTYSLLDADSVADVLDQVTHAATA